MSAFLIMCLRQYLLRSSDCQSWFLSSQAIGDVIQKSVCLMPSHGILLNVPPYAVASYPKLKALEQFRGVIRASHYNHPNREGLQRWGSSLHSVSWSAQHYYELVCKDLSTFVWIH